MAKNQKRGLSFLGGVGVGLINGLLGAGGGMLSVPLLDKLGVQGRKSHATSLAVIVPLSAVSAAIYLAKGWTSLAESLIFLPGGILGALIGAKFLAKINMGILKIIFGGLLIWAGLRQFTA